MARNQALIGYFHAKDFYKDRDDLLNKSNNILGIEYLKALKRLNSSIVPVTIKRINNNYNTEEITGNISSATAIRKHLLKSHNSLQNVLDTTLPEPCYNILNKEFSSGRGPVFASDFYPIISALIRKFPGCHIKEIAYVAEGLENRIKAADSSGTYDELINKICTKRYTTTRIQRILMNIMIGITSRDIKILFTLDPNMPKCLDLMNRGNF